MFTLAETLMADADSRHWGYDLVKRSGICHGTMYVMLRRMLEDGWLTESQEENPPGKRPPRRYYEVTDAGKIAMTALIKRRCS
jgi:PadR family transcriptional regulator PadR